MDSQIIIVDVTRNLQHIRDRQTPGKFACLGRPSRESNDLVFSDVIVEAKTKTTENNRICNLFQILARCSEVTTLLKRALKITLDNKKWMENVTCLLDDLVDQLRR
jgi:hypothetical protein